MVNLTDPLNPLDDQVPQGYTFSGIRNEVPVVEALTGGFEICHRDVYNQTTALANLRGACTGDVLMVACRPVDADVLTVAAMGERAEVLRDVGNAVDASHDHNGLSWYYSPTRSFGFFPTGALVNRNTCDTRNNEPGQRLCWSTSNDNLTSGYRCGATLNPGAAWERVVLHRRGVLRDLGCSMPGGAPVSLRVVNAFGNRRLSYSWVDFGCAEVPAGEIPSGQTVTIETQARYMWVIRDADNGQELWRGVLTDEPLQEVELGLCENAQPIAVDASGGGRFEYSTLGVQSRYTASCAGGANGGEAVFRVTVDVPSFITAETLWADYDTSLFIRSACDDANAEIACDDDGGAGLLSRISIPVNPGTYFVFVDGFSNRSGNGVVDILVEPDDASDLRVIRADMPLSQLQATGDHFSTRFFAPIAIDGYSVGGQPRVAVVYDRSVFDLWNAVWDRDAANFTAWFAQQTQAGFGLVAFDSFVAGGQVRYAGTAVEGAAGVQALVLGRTQAQHDLELAARLADGWRPRRCSTVVTDQLYYDCLYDRAGGGLIQTTAEPVDQGTYEAFLAAQIQQGRTLRDVSIHEGPDGTPRFYALTDGRPASSWSSAVALALEDLLGENAAQRLAGRVIDFVRGYGVGGEARFGAWWGQ
jgi:hypothetical protein